MINVYKKWLKTPKVWTHYCFSGRERERESVSKLGCRILKHFKMTWTYVWKDIYYRELFWHFTLHIYIQELLNSLWSHVSCSYLAKFWNPGAFLCLQSWIFTVLDLLNDLFNLSLPALSRLSYYIHFRFNLLFSPPKYWKGWYGKQYNAICRQSVVTLLREGLF